MRHKHLDDSTGTREEREWGLEAHAGRQASAEAMPKQEVEVQRVSRGTGWDGMCRGRKQSLKRLEVTAEQCWEV
jgi:hypothetical protein